MTIFALLRFFQKEIAPEVLIAYKWKLPDVLDVSIKPSEDGGYFVDVKNLSGCVTQAETGKEIFEMVNDAVYTYLGIPERYKAYMPTFFPPENVRKQFDIKIPTKFLEENLILKRI